jgi:hypothetical protein
MLGAITSLKPNSKSWSILELSRFSCMHSFLDDYLRLEGQFLLLLIARHSSPVVVQKKVKRSPMRVIRASFDQLEDIVVQRIRGLSTLGI